VKHKLKGVPDHWRLFALEAKQTDRNVSDPDGSNIAVGRS
jgi:hypothetical protein